MSRLGKTQLGALLTQNRFSGELDAIAFDCENPDENLIAFAELVLDLFDAVLCDLGDMEEAIGSGEDLDECAELGQADDLAEVRFPNLGTAVRSLIIWMARASPSASLEATLTRPESSTSILTPVASMMPRMTLPPGPMRSRILSVGSGWCESEGRTSTSPDWRLQ